MECQLSITEMPDKLSSKQIPYTRQAVFYLGKSTPSSEPRIITIGIGIFLST